MMRAAGCIPFIAGIVLFSGLIPIFLFTPANVITDRRVDRHRSGRLHQDGLGRSGDRRSHDGAVLHTVPAPRHQDAHLNYTAMPFGWVAFRAALNSHWLVFFVAFGTIMTEVLTVLVASRNCRNDFMRAEAAVDGVAPPLTTAWGRHQCRAGDSGDVFWVSLTNT